MSRSLLCWLLALAAVGMAACTSILGDDFEITAGGGSAAGGGGAGGGASGGGGSTADGPQLVGSSPADGAVDASILPFGLLFFDRPVNWSEATGKVRISSGAHPAEEVAQVEACPDNSPSCVRFVVPVPLTADGRLLGGTGYTVVVDRSFPDPQGHANDADSSVSFVTFDYDLAFQPDIGLHDELGAIAYVRQVAGSPIDALYVTGEGWLNNSGPDVVRLTLDSAGGPTGAQVVATPNIFGVGSCNGSSLVAYGLDHYADRLLLSANYCDAVLELHIEPSGDIAPTPGIIYSTNLPSPDDQLYRVDSVALVAGKPPAGDLYYFGSGTFGSGPLPTGVLEYRPTYMVPWAVWVERVGLFDAAPDYYLTAGTDQGEPYLYLANGDTILKLRHGDKSEANRHTIEGGDLTEVQLRTDDAGRLWVGDASRLVVYDTAGFNGFTVLATREGLDFRRFDVREDGSEVRVYFADFRGPGAIHSLLVQL